MMDDIEYPRSKGKTYRELLPLCGLLGISGDDIVREGGRTQHLQALAGEHGWE